MSNELAFHKKPPASKDTGGRDCIKMILASFKSDNGFFILNP